MREKAGAVGGGETSTRVRLAGGLEEEGTLRVCQGEQCISFKGV